MGRSKPLTLGGIRYKTKGAVRAHIIAVRDQWIGKGKLRGADHDLIAELFAYHHEAAVKAPTGVASFEVKQGPGYDTQCFWVTDMNGDEIDFSLDTALEGAYAAATAASPPA